MTLDERIAAIIYKVNDDKAKQRAKEDVEKRAVDNAIEKIKTLADDIWELLEVANALHANGISLPGEDEYNHIHRNALNKYGYDFDAVADGIRHGVGFMNRGGYPKETIKYVGFYAGGACGKWDFYTDGATTFCRNEDDFYKTRKPNSIECQKFLSMFGQFKNAFYKWFDDVIVNSVSA